MTRMWVRKSDPHWNSAWWWCNGFLLSIISTLRKPHLKLETIFLLKSSENSGVLRWADLMKSLVRADLPEISGKSALRRDFIKSVNNPKDSRTAERSQCRPHSSRTASEIASQIATVWSMKVIYSPLESSGSQSYWNRIEAVPIPVSGFQKPADGGLAFRVFNLRKMKCRPSGQSTRAENLDSDPRKDALIHLFFGAEWR